MQHHPKLSRNERKKKTRRRDESALKNVVSLRISDQEKQILEGISKARSQNVSEIVREAIGFWITRRNGSPLDV